MNFIQDNPDVMIVFDPETGDLLEANVAASEFYGYSRDELLSKNITEINTLPRDEIFRLFSERVNNMATKKFNFKHRLASGEIRDVFVYHGIIAINGKKLIYSIVHDITAQKETEKRLEESEKKFRRILNNTNDAIILAEILSSGMPGRVLEVNSAACRMFGYSKTEFLKIKATSLLDKQSYQHCLSTEKIGGDGKGIFERIVVTKQGLRLIVEISLNIVMMKGEKVYLSVIRDITERRKTEEKKHYLLFEQFRDIILFTMQDGRIIQANKSAERVYGYSREELLALTIKDLAEGQCDCSCGLGNANYLQEGEVLETYHINREGTAFPVEVSWQGLEVQGEQVYIYDIRDITQRKVVEAELFHARKEAERSQRFASMAAMSAGIAHELNQPLNSLKILIDGAKYFSEQGIELSRSDLRERFENISGEINRMDTIIKNMRALVRNQKKWEIEPCKINQILEDTLSKMDHIIHESGINVTKTYHPNIYIYSNNGMLTEVLANLILNALQALDASGRKPKELKVITKMASDIVSIEIADNAGGISKEAAERLFEPFFTTKQPGEGMGLGLSIVKTIVDALNGHITVFNNDQGGATFKVTIPLRNGEGG